MSFWDETITMGNLTVPRFMAAPLDGITDSPLRQLIRRFSPKDLLFTEMRHVASVANAKVNTLFAYKNIEHPLAYQISANKLEWIERAVQKIYAHKFVMLNLNMGCPARQVVKSGSGSALMADIPRYKALVQEIQKHCPKDMPFTIKIRAGFKEPNGVEIAQIAEDLGVTGLIIHPRLQTGGFTAPLDYKMVAEIKKRIKIPVIFSGNINSAKRAQKVHELTGVDGFMIGRPLWGCPWKMHEIQENLAGRDFSVPLAEVIGIAREHLDLNIELYGAHGVNHFKKQLPLYIRGVHGAAQLRAELVRIREYHEMAERLRVVHEQVHEHGNIPTEQIIIPAQEIPGKQQAL